MTLSGAVAAPGVYEIEHGMPLSELLVAPAFANHAAVLVGGYFGTWLPANVVAEARLAGEHLASTAPRWGAG